MIKKFILINILTVVTFAQVNTESLKHTNLDQGNHHSISLSGSLNSGTSSYYLLSNEYRYDYIPQKNNQIKHLFVTKYNYSKNENSTIRNNLFSHYRIIKEINLKNSYEIFIQNESDSFKELKNRILLGFSKRKHFQFSNNLSIIIGLGGMYELEKYTNQSSQSKSVRMTNNIIVSKVINKNLKIDWINYHQPKLFNISNFRVLSVLEIKNRISKKVNISSLLIYDYDSSTPVDYSSSNLNISQKIKFKI